MRKSFRQAVAEFAAMEATAGKTRVVGICQAEDVEKVNTALGGLEPSFAQTFSVPLVSKSGDKNDTVAYICNWGMHEELLAKVQEATEPFGVTWNAVDFAPKKEQVTPILDSDNVKLVDSAVLDDVDFVKAPTRITSPFSPR